MAHQLARPSVPTASPKSRVGQTPPGNTNWQAYSSTGLYLDVDTRSCAAGATPQYITALGGSANHWQTSGATSVYQPTATGFRVYVNYRNGTITPAQANSWQWHLNWRIAAEKWRTIGNDNLMTNKAQEVQRPLP